MAGIRVETLLCLACILHQASSFQTGLNSLKTSQHEVGHNQQALAAAHMEAPKRGVDPEFSIDSWLPELLPELFPPPPPSATSKSVTPDRPRLPEITIIVILAVLAVFFAVVTTTSLMEHFSRFGLGLIACAVYTFIAVCVDVSIMSQKHDDASDQTYTFDPCVCVMTTEIVKLIASVLLYTFFQLAKRESTTAVYSTITWPDIMWWLLPAALFTLNNALVWWAIGKNDSSTYGVLRDTIVLWTALLWKSVFGANLGWPRLLAISMVFAGCVLNQVAKMKGGTTSINWSAGLVLVMTGCNALGTVMNEFALKRRPDLDLNVHNMILYTLCGSLSFIMVLINRAASSGVTYDLFAGFDSHAAFTVALQVSAGLFVSRILAYADAVTKSIAASIRGPILIFVAMSFVPTVLTTATYFSIALVFAGCFYFLVQGPLSKAVPQNDNKKAEEVQEAKAHQEKVEEDVDVIKAQSPKTQQFLKEGEENIEDRSVIK